MAFLLFFIWNMHFIHICRCGQKYFVFVHLYRSIWCLCEYVVEGTVEFEDRFDLLKGSFLAQKGT